MAVINKIKKGTVEYDIQDLNAATKTELQALETTVNGKQNALTETQLSAVNSGIDSTKVGQIATNAGDIDNIEAKIPTEATAQNQLADKSFVNAADTNLQSQIDAISASSDVTDIVGTKAALDAYDTSGLKDNDIIKVLQDESQNDETTYYRWSTTTNTFTLIGEEGPYYTKSQADTLLEGKVDKVTGKGLSENDFTDADATKLSGIETGAEVNDINSISVNGTPITPDANKNVDLTIDQGIKTLTTADYDVPAATPTAIYYPSLAPGIYQIKSSVVSFSGYSSGSNPFYLYENDMLFKNGNSIFYYSQLNGLHVRNSETAGDYGSLWPAVDNLTSSAAARPLSAKQGRALNGKIEGRIITGSGAPTTSTVGTVGKLYEDTTNGKLYQCTSVSGGTYTWRVMTSGYEILSITQTDYDNLQTYDPNTLYVITGA